MYFHLCFADNIGIYVSKEGLPEMSFWQKLFGRNQTKKGITGQTLTADEQYELGRKHAEGNGVRRDDVEAVKWYKLAAKRGHAGAQNNLGAMYVEGRGVPASDAEGFSWYKKAAEQGAASAQNNLGVMYYLGKGTSKNLTEAKKWWKRSAAQGNSSAQKHLDMV